MNDPDVRLFYRTLVEEEGVHEKELNKLKTSGYQLAEPDMAMLRESGYLDALSADPQMTLHQAIAFALKKKNPPRLLYSTLADCTKDEKLAVLFRHLAEQEQQHADYFQKELERLRAKV